MAPQPKPELPNPAASRRRISSPRRANSMRPNRSPACRRRSCRLLPPLPPPPLAISEILVPTAAPRPRSRPICRPIIRSSPARVPAPPRLAVGAHRRVRKRDQRNPRRAERAGVVVELHRRRAPRRAGGGRPAATRAGKAKADKAKARERDQGRRQGALDHHLQDPLAAGRRERGRDRARHLQDGDEPARRRQPPPQIPGLERSADQPAPLPPADSGAKAPAPEQRPAPSMTSPTPIGRQSQNNAAPAPPDASATVEIPQAPATACADLRQRHHRLDPERDRAGKGAMLQVPQGEQLPERSADRTCARPR